MLDAGCATYCRVGAVHHRFEPDGRAAVDDVEAAIDLLTDALLSHLAYEERELVEPLDRLGLLV